MNIRKSETVSAIAFLEKLHKILPAKSMTTSLFINAVNTIAKFCIQVYSTHQDNPDFRNLFEHVNATLARIVSLQNNAATDSDPLRDLTSDRLQIIYLVEKFEISLIKSARFHYYLFDCEEKSLPINHSYSVSGIRISHNADGKETFSFQHNGKPEISVLVHSGFLQDSLAAQADFHFQAEEIQNIQNKIKGEMESIDYFSHDRLYLEAKLDSLKRRNDIKLLLAGSSYTMCGLLENQMPFPARNVAVDAQDIYYTIKTVRTALEYNPNIQYCILSFAYYLWGNDLSRSTSEYNNKRITEIDYPIFKDLHNFAGFPNFKKHKFVGLTTPLQNYLFLFSILVEQYNAAYRVSFENADYFPQGRWDCNFQKIDKKLNMLYARKRAESHNKFYKYEETVRENRKLFADFLDEMNRRNIQILLYVPPASEYYQKSIDPQLITNFYSLIKPLQEAYNFKLIDLFDSKIFQMGDFADYDHLNNYGAEKLAKRLTDELNKIKS